MVIQNSWLCAAALLGVTVLSVPAQTEVFNLSNFDDVPSFAYQGAAVVADGRVQLSGAAGNASGGVWNGTKLFLEGGFETTFEFQLGDAAEGIVFVIHNNALPLLGGSGGGLGYDGLPNSLAVEFDASGGNGDLPGAHISVQTRGTFPNSASPEASLMNGGVPTLANDTVHSARVRYTPGMLEVFLDDMNNPVVTAAVSLENVFPLDRGQAWFGVVAASGANPANQILRSWKMSLLPTALSVELESPLEGGSFPSPAFIPLRATVTGPDAITNVAFYHGSTLLFNATNAPYQYDWDTMPPGPYTITAVASDVSGRKVTSLPVRIFVFPPEPAIGINFVTAPDGSTYSLDPVAVAGVIPQHYWNNALMVTNGVGALANVRNAAGNITPIDVQFDFGARGEEPQLDANFSADHRLMRIYGATAAGQAGSIVQFQSIPFPIYDLILYTDGANGAADRVSQFRIGNQSQFVRDAANGSFAGIYVQGNGTSDAGADTPPGNYVRFNGLTGPSFTLTNIARSAADGSPLGAINAVQIVPSVYDKNSPVFLTRGPYLQIGTPTSMTVRWRSNRPVSSRVRYGTDPTNLTDMVEDTVSKQEHIVTLTNLLPDTRYYYSVGSDQTNLLSGPRIFFWTSPVTAKPTRIWVVGDAGTAGNGAPDRQQSVRDAFDELNGGRYVDLFLMLGDNAYNSGTDIEYQRAVFEMYTNTLPQTPVWPTLGNHETGQSHTPVPTTPYLNIFTLPENGEAGGVPSGTERYYSFDYGNIHFICLDSMTNDRSTNGPMANWLQADLEANTNHWIIAFFHHPPYTKGSHDSDNTGGDFELVEMRENINPILEAYGVDLVMSGHSHCYERSVLLNGHYGFSWELEPSMILDAGSGSPASENGPYTKTSDGTVYMVDGSSGQATFTSAGWPHPVMHQSILQLGSVILDIDGNELIAQFVRETGAIDDTFAIVKQMPAPAPGVLRITSSSLREGTLTLSWNSHPGTRYVVERTSTIGDPEWIPISEPLTALGDTHSWSGPLDSAASASFYRVVALE